MKRLSILITGLGLGGLLLLTTAAIFPGGSGGTVTSNSVSLLGFVGTNGSGANLTGVIKGIVAGSNITLTTNGLVITVATGGASQTPIAQDVNFATFQATNFSKLVATNGYASFGSNVVSGASGSITATNYIEVINSSGSIKMDGGNLTVSGTGTFGGTAGFLSLKTNAGGTVALPAGSIGIYGDVTANNVMATNLAGVVTHMVATKAAVANQLVSAINDAGTVTTRALHGGDITGISPTNVPTLTYTTNSGAALTPDFTKAVTWLTTNAAFTFLAPVGVNLNAWETTTTFVTNSTASVVAITCPTAGVATGQIKTNGVWNVTNLTAITWNHLGNFTNAIAYPIF